MDRKMRRKGARSGRGKREKEEVKVRSRKRGTKIN